MWVFSTSRLAHTITIENIIKSSWTASGHHRDPLNFHSLEFQLINIALWPHLTHSTRELNDFAEYHHVWVWGGRSRVRLCTGRHWLSPIANKGCNCVDSRPHHKQISIKFKFTCFSVSLSTKSQTNILWMDEQIHKLLHSGSVITLSVISKHFPTNYASKCHISISADILKCPVRDFYPNQNLSSFTNLYILEEWVHFNSSK